MVSTQNSPSLSPANSSSVGGGNTASNGSSISSSSASNGVARACLLCRPNSHPFNDRTLALDQPVKVGRSVARARATQNNAIFDCKVRFSKSITTFRFCKFSQFSSGFVSKSCPFMVRSWQILPPRYQI